ncbi:SRPBCC family protein [Sinomonas atrocyanea]|uniref:SRPBCC family protein n=1 Tax=Sinomonas atrocyanea TaxID=37927 RepID=UPI003D9553EE
MGVIEHSVWIKAAPEAVWHVYTDPRRIPEWETGSPVIEDLGGDGASAGSAYTSRRRALVARTSVIESEPPRRLVTHTDASLGLRFDVTSELSTDGDGTRLRLRVVTSWPRGLGVLGRVVEHALLGGREAAKELGNLRALIEAPSP